MTNITTLVAGIDTAKDKLDVAVHGRPDRLQVANTRAGWRRLSAILLKAGVARIGVEASGGYERGVVAHLRAAGCAVLVLQPIQVRAYARMHLRRAKNDQLDAGLIAACVATLDPPAVEPDARLASLADALTFVEQIEEDIARLKVRLEHIQQPRLRRMVMADIARLTARRRAELARIAAALRAHPDLATRLHLVLSVPGIGEAGSRSAFINVTQQCRSWPPSSRARQGPADGRLATAFRHNAPARHGA